MNIRPFRRLPGSIVCAVALVAAPLSAQITTPPTLAPPPALVLPAVERSVLPNGLTVLVSRNAEVPVVEMQLVVNGGARLPHTPPGVAALTGTLLTEGAGSRDALKLAEAIDFLGASLRATAGWETVTLSLRAPRRNVDSALALLSDVVFRPAFASADVRRQRDLRITALGRAKDNPGAVASRIFSRNVYPAGHPFHMDLGGDSISVAAIDSAAIRDYWRRTSDPRHATLIVTGDVTMADATAWAAKYFGRWASPATAEAKPPASSVAAAPRPATHVILVDKPGAAQSVILIGTPGVERSSPDYPAITLMNTIMGGSFSARLNDFLREKLGYSYGAYSQYSWSPVAGPFTAQGAVRTDVTDSSLMVFFREMARMRNEPVSDVELARGKNYVVLGALSDYETAGQVNRAIATSLSFGRPLSMIPTEYAAINRLTAADVQRAAKMYLDPGNMTVVVVGDLAKIRAGIEKLGLGPIEVQVY